MHNPCSRTMKMKHLYSLLALWLWCSQALASELDLYLGNPQSVPARIMLLVDTSASMTERLGGGGDCGSIDPNDNCVSKMEVLKDTLSRFIDANQDPANAAIRWPDHYSVGLSYYSWSGAIILAPVRQLGEQVNGQTHRQYLANAVAQLPASGYTPLLSSYLETVEYLMGGMVLSQGSYDNSVAEAWVDGNRHRYAQGFPPQLVCNRSNDHLVVLTDGLSTSDNMGTTFSIWPIVPGRNANMTYGHQLRNRVLGRTGETSYLEECPSTVRTTLTSHNAIWPCANVLAASLVDKRNPDNITGIRTHTIAYDLGSANSTACEDVIDNPQEATDFLCNWAKAGGGNSYIADDAEGLANAFQGLLGEFEYHDSFMATVPGVSVNQSNRFSFLDDIYYSVFRPSDRRVWYGNLKKYRLGLHNDLPAILDAAGNRVDANGDGFFDTNIRSFWFRPADYDPAITADGDRVVLGGAALRIPPKAERRLFTSLDGSTTIAVSDGNAATVAASLLAEEYESDAEREQAETEALTVVDWLRGDDAEANNEWARVTAELPEAQRQPAKPTRTLYGAPVHSSPVVVNYTSIRRNGQNPPQILAPNEQDNLVFLSTNDGKLYVVDAQTGEEKLAFVPGELLKRSTSGEPSMIETYYQAARNNTPGDFIWGLDANWTVWRQDVNADGNITSSGSNDFVYLYGGMRRGGRHYYGLDMTRANDGNPSMEQLFVLRGGIAGTEMENIGQTWSEPVLGMIRYNNEAVVVMVVGGGYDPLYDTTLPGNQTPQGAQLYIVAAHNRSEAIRAGDVLWWASSSAGAMPGNHHRVTALTDSIPSTVKVLDKDGDGFLDHIYVADLGGTLMRFDINNANSGHQDLVSNTDNVVVAELGRDAEDPLSADDRRFFHPPSIALMRDGRGRHVGIAIGSGKITDPKDNTVDERFFFVRDYVPFGGTVAAEDNPVYSYELAEHSEKFLGSPLIVGGRVMFSTYYWGDNRQAEADQCRPGYGRAALYSYDPVADETTQLGRDYPQSVAGSLTTVLQSIPEARGEDGELLRPEGSDFIGIGGTAAFDLPDVDLGNIRKTRWKQCLGSGPC